MYAARSYLSLRVQVSWICWDWQFHRPGFHGNHASRYASQSVAREGSLWYWQLQNSCASFLHIPVAPVEQRNMIPSINATSRYCDLKLWKKIEICMIIITWLCPRPHSEPKAAWSPWRNLGRRNHFARNLLELYTQEGRQYRHIDC